MGPLLKHLKRRHQMEIAKMKERQLRELVEARVRGKLQREQLRKDQAIEINYLRRQAKRDLATLRRRHVVERIIIRKAE